MRKPCFQCFQCFKCHNDSGGAREGADREEILLKLGADKTEVYANYLRFNTSRVGQYTTHYSTVRFRDFKTAPTIVI